MGLFMVDEVRDILAKIENEGLAYYVTDYLTPVDVEVLNNAVEGMGDRAAEVQLLLSRLDRDHDELFDTLDQLDSDDENGEN